MGRSVNSFLPANVTFSRMQTMLISQLLLAQGLVLLLGETASLLLQSESVWLLSIVLTVLLIASNVMQAAVIFGGFGIRVRSLIDFRQGYLLLPLWVRCWLFAFAGSSGVPYVSWIRHSPHWQKLSLYDRLVDDVSSWGITFAIAFLGWFVFLSYKSRRSKL
ncbi:MAG: hypothetical protein ABL973_06185 [Micropepsaceae bacterium]